MHRIEVESEKKQKINKNYLYAKYFDKFTSEIIKSGYF